MMLGHSDLETNRQFPSATWRTQGGSPLLSIHFSSNSGSYMRGRLSAPRLWYSALWEVIYAPRRYRQSPHTRV